MPETLAGGMGFLVRLSGLFVPLTDFSGKPICPFLNTLAGEGGDFKHDYVGIELFDPFPYCIGVEVEVGLNINLVDKQSIYLGEHKWILEGLVITLGNGKQHNIQGCTGIKLGGADKVTHVF